MLGEPLLRVVTAAYIVGPLLFLAGTCVGSILTLDSSVSQTPAWLLITELICAGFAPGAIICLLGYLLDRRHIWAYYALLVNSLLQVPVAVFLFSFTFSPRAPLMAIPNLVIITAALIAWPEARRFIRETRRSAAPTTSLPHQTAVAVPLTGAPKWSRVRRAVDQSQDPAQPQA